LSGNPQVVNNVYHDTRTVRLHTFSSSNQSVLLAASVISSTPATANGRTLTLVVPQGMTQIGSPVKATTVSGDMASAAGVYAAVIVYMHARQEEKRGEYTAGGAAGTTATVSNAIAPFLPINQNVTLSATVTSSAGTVNGETTINPITDVSGHMTVTQSGFGRNRQIGIYTATLTVTNNGATAINGPVQMVFCEPFVECEYSK